jgi:hypothetical protein
MKGRVLIGIALAVAIAPILIFAIHREWNRRSVARTREQLAREGFKTHPSDFRLSIPEEAIRRGKTLRRISAPITATSGDDIRRNVLDATGTFMMTASNSAALVWKQKLAASPKKRSPWPAVRLTIEKDRIALHAATAALLEGPIGFPDPRNDEYPYAIEHLPDCIRTFAFCMLADLHDDMRNEAWTNLLALTRLVTAWKPQPIPYFHRVRFILAPLVFSAAWNAMEAHAWSDAQLAALENEWSGIEFFKALPEAVAMEGACWAEECEKIRQAPVEWPWPLDEMLKQPKEIPEMFRYFAYTLSYRWQGSYTDEKHALIYFRDRQIDVREAVAAQSLDEMRSSPGMIYAPRFVSKYKWPPAIQFSDEDICVQTARGRSGLLGMAAQAEIRRRIILTAIALERHRNRTGKYPENLSALPPSRAYLDFSDGKPLRYHRTTDQFFLYSIGWDGTDDGGNASRTNRSAGFFIDPAAGTDIIWPLAIIE